MSNYQYKIYVEVNIPSMLFFFKFKPIEDNNFMLFLQYVDLKLTFIRQISSIHFNTCNTVNQHFSQQHVYTGF